MSEIIHFWQAFTYRRNFQHGYGFVFRFRKRKAIEKPRSSVKCSRAFPYGTCHRAAAPLGPGSSVPTRKMVPNGHLWLVFRACTCCIFPHIFCLFGVGDPKKLFAEIKQRWVCFSLPREWGTAMRFWVSTTLKSPEIFGFLQFSFLNSIGGVFFMFDLKDPQNICPHQSFIYLPRGKHSPRLTQTRKA